MASSSATELLNLNVGGHFYTTTRSTLTRYPDSMLGLMFSAGRAGGQQPARRDDNNRYYIDGDGPTFRHILNFLRRSKLNIPHGFKDWNILAAEADFYQIPDLIRCISERRKGTNQSLLEVQYVYTAGTSIEKRKTNYWWKVCGEPKILDKLSSIVKFEDSYGDDVRIMRKDDMLCLDFTRTQLFGEINKIGFTFISTVSTSSSNANFPGNFDGKDRWIFIKDDSN